eukprot:3294413-Prymnesium_polylepis.1
MCSTAGACRHFSSADSECGTTATRSYCRRTSREAWMAATWVSSSTCMFIRISCRTGCAVLEAADGTAAATAGGLIRCELSSLPVDSLHQQTLV